MKWSLVLFLLLPFPLKAIIVFRDPGRMLEPPGDEAMKDCWNLHGAWQGATGVIVARNWFLTAAHMGAHVGGFFDWNYHSYLSIQAVAVPDCDLMLYRVEGNFPRWAELWDDNCGSEISRRALLIGRGCARGPAIEVEGRPKAGWSWGDSDGKLSWGQNEIAQYFNAGDNYGSLLVWTWDSGLDDLGGTLGVGDSGGGLFLMDEKGEWRLAGIHFDVDPSVGGADTQYCLTENGDPFWASIHDGRGLWKGVMGAPLKELDPKAARPIPMWAGSTRIAPHASFIRSVITEGSQVGERYEPAVRWSLRKVMALVAGLSGLGLLGIWWGWREARRKGR